MKLLGGAAFATALIIGPALPALAETSTYQVGEQLLRDGNPEFTADSDEDTLWYRESTRAGGSVDLYKGTDAGSEADPGAISASGPPGFGDGALALSTNHQSASKAQLLSPHRTFNRALADVNSVTYYTYQDAASEPTNPGAKVILPSLQLQIDTNGFSESGGFTTLVFEPYQENGSDPPSTPIASETWQQWDATTKKWWSSSAIHCEGGAVDPFDLAAGAGGPPFTTLQEVAANCPDAVIIQFGVNVGAGGQPGAVTATDGLHIGIGTDSYTWDFGPK
jgi:hypothetical protein